MFVILFFVMNCVYKIFKVRLVGRCAYPFFIFAGIMLCVMSSCSSRRIVSISDHITDTTYVSVRDTTHTVIVRDTTIVTEREVITEHIVNHYDPSSGMLTQQEVDRIVQRTRDSLATRLLDEITHLYDSINESSHADEHHLEDEKAQGEASLSVGQIFAKTIASIVACAFLIFGLVFISKQILR